MGIKELIKRDGCKHRYRKFKKCAIKFKSPEEAVEKSFTCSKLWFEFEDQCGEFKSKIGSRWWTKKHEKRACDVLSHIYYQNKRDLVDKDECLLSKIYAANACNYIMPKEADLRSLRGEMWIEEETWPERRVRSDDLSRMSKEERGLLETKVREIEKEMKAAEKNVVTTVAEKGKFVRVRDWIRMSWKEQDYLKIKEKETKMAAAATMTKEKAAVVKEAVTTTKETVMAAKEAAATAMAAKEAAKTAKETAMAVKEAAKTAKETAMAVKEAEKTAKETAMAVKEAAETAKEMATVLKEAAKTAKGTTMAAEKEKTAAMVGRAVVAGMVGGWLLTLLLKKND